MKHIVHRLFQCLWGSLVQRSFATIQASPTDMLALGLMMVVYSTMQSQPLDLSNLQITTPDRQNARVMTAIEILKEEVEKRTGLRWELDAASCSGKAPTLYVAVEQPGLSLSEQAAAAIAQLPASRSEGFKICHVPEEQTTYLVGHDERGVLYGIGWLLRKMVLTRSGAQLPQVLPISSSPRYPIRGHQLGYRPKTNAYDAWSAATFDQYIRDLAVFGANSIEIMPPRTDDDFTSVHMEIPAAEMIVEQSLICDKYGLDVWMWYPNMGTDYEHPDSLAKELAERHQIFSSVPRLDHLFVPGGDPGELDPSLLFEWLKQVATVLHTYHPQAKIWVSPQVFRPTKAWFDIFYREVNQRYPWFGGVVFGPWVKVPIDELRTNIDPALPIRRYPDITHSLSSQYPYPEWDLSWAITLGRECINPRPKGEKIIHNALDQYADGSLSYSEGTNDDVNKFIWSIQDWDPTVPAIETMRDYARYFIDAEHTEALAQAFLCLESNCDGPLLTNEGVVRCLKQWQEIETTVDESARSNYRFQMGLIRAYFDAYVFHRLFFETANEQKARAILERAETLGPDQAIALASHLLQDQMDIPAFTAWRDRCHVLADDLFESIGAQLTVARHQAMKGRGNFVDHIDLPLSDAPWLLDQLQLIDPSLTDDLKLERIKAITGRTDPGPGGFYDNFGDPRSWARVYRSHAWSEDPGHLRSARVSFGVGMLGKEWVHEITAKGFSGQATPLAWMNQVTSLYDLPLLINYDDLNPGKTYRVRVAYTGRFRSRQKLSVDGIVLHDFIKTGEQPLYEFALPPEATADGSIQLKWECGEGERGSQVSEVWILCEP